MVPSTFHHRGGSMRRFLIAAAAALIATPAVPQQKIDFILNWVPGGDHAPYYYAKKLGWYQKEGIDLNLEPGKGSALATQKVGAGANPYGNSVIVNAEYLKKNKPAVAKFVQVTQRAFAECVKQPKPCVQALIDANGALSFDNELVNWQLVEVLMSDKISQTVALGWHDDQRMQADYQLVRDYVGVDKPFDVKTTYTNEFLDKSIKMKAVKGL